MQIILSSAPTGSTAHVDANAKYVPGELQCSSHINAYQPDVHCTVHTDNTVHCTHTQR